MRPQIKKDDAWRNMSYAQGQAPTVVNQVESRVRLFEFQAPKASLRIDTDSEPRFKPEGDWEITRGDEIRIYSGSVLVFQGLVDREIRYSEKDGTTSFRASGWISDINQLVAGRIIDGAFGEDLYRYRKIENEIDNLETEDINEAENQFEYIATSGIYEDDWFDDLPKRSGYGKVSIFNTRSILPSGVFQSENNRATGFELITRGSSFSNSVFRREIVDGDKAGSLFSIDLEDVITELITQINIAKSGVYSQGDVDLGTISGEFAIAVPLDPRLFRIIHFMPMEVGDSSELFPVLWTFEEREIDAIRVVEISRIVSQFDLEVLERLDFSQSIVAIPSPDEYQILDSFWTIQTLNIDGKLVVLQQWGSVRFEFGNPGTLWQVFKAEWYVYDPVTDNFQGVFQKYTIDSDNFVVNDPEDLDYNVYRSVTFTDDLTGAEFSEDSFPDNDLTTYQSESGIYSLVDSKIIFTGELTISDIAFEFDNMRVTKMIVEICKLTNSLFFIDNDRQVNLVSRSFFNNVAIKSIADIESFRQTIQDNYGDEAPVVRSEIVENEAFNNLLQEFYIDTFFAEKEDQWEIVADRNTNNVSINLLDQVTWGGISGEPTIVRRSELRGNNVILTVTRARAA